MPTFRHIPRRVVPAALAVGMILSILPAGMTTANDEPAPVSQAEWEVLSEINRVRENHGLVPLRMAGRVRNVAEDRSRSMKRLNYFGHVSPYGNDAGDLLDDRGIGWRYWGEVIGWTVGMPLTSGSRWMVDWWKGSPVHRSLILSRNFNYAGVGVVRDDNLTLWTVVLVNQADHTPPTSNIWAFQPASGERATQTAASGTVVRWWGRDPRLSARTAGLDTFSVQHKVQGGKWRMVRHRTKARQGTFDLQPGVHLFRVRARDNRGNLGRWKELRVTVD